MRLKEADVALPLQSSGLNNNQLRRSGQNQPLSNERENRNENEPSSPNNRGNLGHNTPTFYSSEEIEDFRVAEDTTTWSSLAITRDNVRRTTSNENDSNINNNNNLASPRIHRNSSVESLADYEGRNSSQDDSSQELTPSDWSDWSEDGNLPAGCRGIINPNYPGFQHLAPSLLSDTDLTEDEHESCVDYGSLNEIDANSTENVDNKYNNNVEDNINHLAGQRNERKTFYEKPKFNIQTVTSLYEAVVPPSEKCINYVNSVTETKSTEEPQLVEPAKDELRETVLEVEKTILEETTLADQLEIPVEIEVVEVITSVKESLQFPEIEEIPDSGKNSEIGESGPYESVAPLSEQSTNDTRPTEEVAERSEEKVTEEETHPTVLKADEALEKFEQPVSAEDGVVELSGEVEENHEFPETKDIQDTRSTEKIKETREPEEIIVEQIDLIREAKELPHQSGPKIGNRQAIPSSGSHGDDSESNSDSESYHEGQPTYTKLEEIDLLSSIGRDIGVDLEKYVQPVPDVVAMETLDPIHGSSRATTNPRSIMKDGLEDTNKLIDRELSEASTGDARKKEKMVRNQAKRRQQQQQQQMRGGNTQKRPDKRRADPESSTGGFDVYNIETAMPKIDLDAIESHLRAAREEERREDDKDPPKKEEPRIEKPLEQKQSAKENEREDLLARFDKLICGCHQDVPLQRRNDREEIRRRLAMGPDAEDLRAERGRKPSLQSRLQSGMNLQICFMNETPSDTESPCSESDASPGPTPTSIPLKLNHQGQNQTHQKPQHPQQLAARPQMLSLPPLRLDVGPNSGPIDEADFFARQARLQTEARMALAQAKEMAHMQMEVERQRLKQSPITEMVRSSLEKVGVQLGEDRRRLSRVLLTELNVAQLQVVANDLHARIAALNEALVEGLLRRDDLHMEQDSMLVDVEDLTRYLGAKQESLKKKQQQQQPGQNQPGSKVQPNNVQSKLSLMPKLSHRGLVALVRK